MIKSILNLLLVSVLLCSFISCSSSKTESSDIPEIVGKEQAKQQAKTEITGDNVEKVAEDMLKELESEAE